MMCYSLKPRDLNNLLQMHLKLLQKEQLKKQQRQLLIGIKLADKVIKSQGLRHRIV